MNHVTLSVQLIQLRQNAKITAAALCVALDNHDIISMKLYQLTVDRTADEEEEEVTIPSVDNVERFQGNLLFCRSSQST